MRASESTRIIFTWPNILQKGDRSMNNFRSLGGENLDTESDRLEAADDAGILCLNPLTVLENSDANLDNLSSVFWLGAFSPMLEISSSD